MSRDCCKILVLTLLSSFGSGFTPFASAARIFLVSRTSEGAGGDQESNRGALAASGRVVAFCSEASDLVVEDDNGVGDLFHGLWPFDGCSIDSLDWDDDPVETGTDSPVSLSVNGRLIVFDHWYDDLLENDTNEMHDVFLRDTTVGRTILVGTNAMGEQTNYESYGAYITLDGQYVSFNSYANNLVTDDRNRKCDVFLKCMVTGEVDLISISTDGVQGDRDSNEGQAPVSADARYVAFNSRATNLVSGDTNGVMDVFVRDRKQRTTIRVNLKSNGQQAGSESRVGGISADGRYVVLQSGDALWGNDLNEAWDVYLRDLEKEETWLVSVNSSGFPADKGGTSNAISASGRYVAFESVSTNLDERCTDYTQQIYVRDLTRETTTLASVNDDGEPANDHCEFPQVSANGRFITFSSAATNLVDVDTHGVEQVYVIDFLGCSEHVRGDSNCDGAVDYADIDAFVLALIDEGEYVLQNLSCDWKCNNDINGDQAVDFNDIDGFVECLINGGCE